MSWQNWAAQRRGKLSSITAALLVGAVWIALDPPNALLLAQPSDVGLAEQTQTPQEQQQQQQQQPPPQTPQEQGRYLVHEVAMCVQCHSPRNADGSLDAQRLLTGAPIPLESPFPNQQWAPRSPRLAGLPGWTDEQLITLLVTGARPNGRQPRPPMPKYHLTPSDAAAVAAYLRSIPR